MESIRKPRTAISNWDFDRLLETAASEFVISDKILSVREINFINKKISSCKFNNCEFTAPLVVELGNVHFSVNECDFKEGVMIYSLIISNSVAALDFQESTFTFLRIDSTNFSKFIINESEIKSLRLADIHVATVLDLSDTKIFNLFDFRNISIADKLIFDNTIIESTCYFKGLQTKEFEINRSILKDSFSINESEFNIYWERLVVEGSTSISNSKIDNIDLSGCAFKSDFLVNYSKGWFSTDKLRSFDFNEVSINSCSFDGGLNLGYDTDVGRLRINTLLLVCASSSSGNVVFEYFDIRHLSITGYNRDAAFIFNDCIFTELLVFFRLINNGKIVLNGSSLVSTTDVVIQESTVGPLNLIGVDFSQSAMLHFYNSDLTDIKNSSVKWGDRLEIFDSNYFNNKREKFIDLEDESLKILSDSNSEIIFLSNKREMYRHLKSVYDKNNDRIEFLKFQRLEIQAYRKLLRLQKKSNLPDRFILALEWTNDYGQNWFKPFLFAVLGTMAMGLPISYYSCQDFLIGNYGWATYSVEEYFIDVFQLLNPIHSIDKISPDPNSVSAWIWGLDYFQRLYMTFFIVQTVSGFRKYLKK